MKALQVGDVVRHLTSGVAGIVNRLSIMDAKAQINNGAWFRAEELELIYRPEPPELKPGPITGGVLPVKPTPVPQFKGVEPGSRFRRGERVEAAWHEDGEKVWYPAIYLLDDSGVMGGMKHIVSFDISPDAIHGVDDGDVRRPSEKVTVYLWRGATGAIHASDSEDMSPLEVDAVSIEVEVPEVLR